MIRSLTWPKSQEHVSQMTDDLVWKYCDFNRFGVLQMASFSPESILLSSWVYSCFPVRMDIHSLSLQLCVAMCSLTAWFA